MNEPVVRCTSVGKSYGGVTAVDGSTMDLQRGEILAVLGPSGCGKTTLLRLIAGFERVDSGQISINDAVVSGARVHIPPERRNVGMLFQEYALFPHLTVAANVSFGLRNVSGDERRRRLEEVMDLVRLSGLESRYPHELSGGQQQRVALARTLAPRPVTMLLDEPFSNIDAGLRSEMRREVARILRDSEISTVFVTHDRDEAYAMSDRIAVMLEGRIEQVAAPDILYRSPVNPSVARMAGAGDFLAGEARDGRVYTEIGTLPMECLSETGPEGSAVEVLVQPGDLEPREDLQGTAVVEYREFRGDETLLLLRLSSGATLRCRERPHTMLAPGTRVELSPARTTPFVAFSSSEAEA